MYAVGKNFDQIGEKLMKLREVGRVAAILGATLTFLVGAVSIVLGVVNSSPDQGG